MADRRDDDLPEGTDTVIAGASRRPTNRTDATLDRWTAEPTTGAANRGAAASPNASAAAATTRRPGRRQGARPRRPGARATSEALANVSKLVGDTAAGHR